MAEDLPPVVVDSPARQPRASPVNGVVPPVEHQWQPGQSGNPSGGWKDPPGPRLRRALTKLLDSQPELAAQIVQRIADEAVNGDPRAALQAASILWDREEGKAAQKVEHSGSVTNVTISGMDSP